jgi:hypothetical protein
MTLSDFYFVLSKNVELEFVTHKTYTYKYTNIYGKAVPLHAMEALGGEEV